ncbi:MAG: protease modulator HflC [Salibaculum sp.]|jgi:membrane protease subunit HflC|uniref:protease modulator HflC n=1 Tax=Salibaculum sp. TaxID=2855480 RepID=UPI00287078E0|nr:protease modulator HflC [Salibaculum sp.]MDR9428579.1 protease modulator HflC [Salibaculum sp.]MDR9483024.1 protease modulator HflC [Salibaculum sp.]
MRKLVYLLPILLVALVGILSSIFVVDEREKALVLRFGRVVQVKTEPGLAFRVPFLDQVVSYDDRIISIDMAQQEVIPDDDRRLIVDAFARYRIDDVIQFREATGAGGDMAITVADNRLEQILRATTRQVLGSVSSDEILSQDRDALMLRIRNGAIEESAELGLTVVDVRLKRTDLPPENLAETFRRMVSEREREAEDERARGREAAQRIRAQADRTVVELVSDAEREARIIEGEADAERNKVFAEAFNQDREFFEFYRSLEAYGKALQEDSTRLVLSPDHAFFDYMRSPSGAPAAPQE